MFVTNVFANQRAGDSQDRQRATTLAARPWTREDYVAFFDRFLALEAPDMSATRFSYHAVGEPSFLSLLRKGERKFRLDTIEKAVLFVKTYRVGEGKKRKNENGKRDAGA